MEENLPPKKKWAWWKIAIAAIVAISIVNGLVATFNPDYKKQLEGHQPTQAEIAKSDSIEAVNKKQSKINRDVETSFIKADRAIKRTLKDPDSYERIEHSESFVGKNGVYVACLVKYRAKNSFGGFAVEKMMVTFNNEMEPIEVVPEK